MSSAGVALSPVRNDVALAQFGRSLPHCPPDSILIYLAVPGSAVVPMRVLESDSIAAVKLRIQSSSGFVVQKQRLVFSGRELTRNDCHVCDYGVADGGVLHLVVRLSDLRTITVRTACGRKLRLCVERCRTISYVKQRIVEHRGGGLSDLSDHQLVYDGEELDDHRLISDMCKFDDAVLHLLVRKSAKVRTKSVEKDFKLSIVAPDAGEGSLRTSSVLLSGDHRKKCLG